MIILLVQIYIILKLKLTFMWRPAIRCPDANEMGLKMSKISIKQVAAAVVTLGAVLAVPTGAWAGIAEQIGVISEYSGTIVTGLGILGALLVIDTITWPFLTDQR